MPLLDQLQSSINAGSRKSNDRNITVEIHSDEVQDIISRAPNRLLQASTFVVLFVFLAFFAASWFIRYPDVAIAGVTVTTVPSPVILVSRSSGKLQLLKKEGEHVEDGDLVAFVQSSAVITDVLQLEKIIDLLSTSTDLAYRDSLLLLTASFKLGDLQSAATSFFTSHREWYIFANNRLEIKQIGQLKKQIRVYQEVRKNQQVKQQLMERELALTNEKFSTDSTLFSQKVISKIDFNQSKAVYIQQQRLLRNAEAEVFNTQLQINSSYKQIEEIEASAISRDTQLSTANHLALNELKTQIKKWKEAFLFIASEAGTVAYLEYLENDQYTETSKNLFSIVPDGGEIIGKAELPLIGSGKVKAGQRVNIRLDNYPFEQFGMLTGVVKTISLLPSGDKYLVVIVLSNGMRTTYHKELPFQQQLKGQTEIITEDFSIIERIFHQFRKLLKRR